MAKKAVKKREDTDNMAKAPSYINTSEGVDIPKVDSAMPFPVIKLIQQLSPELDDEDSKFIPEAEPGDIVITDGTSSKLFKGSIHFIPVLVRKSWTEWIPRKQGGGFAAFYLDEDEMKANRSPDNEIAVSIDYLGVCPENLEDGNVNMVLLQFNSPTKMAIARDLNKLITNYGTLHGVTYILSSKKQSNKSGQKFFNFSISASGWTNKDIYTLIDAVKDETSSEFLPEPEVF